MMHFRERALDDTTIRREHPTYPSPSFTAFTHLPPPPRLPLESCHLLILSLLGLFPTIIIHRSLWPSLPLPASAVLASQDSAAPSARSHNPSRC